MKDLEAEEVIKTWQDNINQILNFINKEIEDMLNTLINVELTDNFKDDYGLDSLDVTELIWSCEEKFNVDVFSRINDVKDMTTVEQLVSIIWEGLE
jgi:acyl carrier protein